MSTGSVRLDQITPLDELTGKLSPDPEEKRLMRSVLENDEDVITNGRLVSSALNAGISSFTPDMLFDKLVTNYKTAKNIYGTSFLREISGYGESPIERNLHIGEFRQELRKRIQESFRKLKDGGFVDGEGGLTEKAHKLSTIILYTQELDKLSAKGLLGERERKKSHSYGMKDDVRRFAKDRYRDIAVRKTLKLAARRGHSRIEKSDLVAFERKSRGKRSIIYALDASGSMKGERLVQGKKAGIALSYKALQEKDRVGMIAFGKEVRSKVRPTDDFRTLLKELTRVSATGKTNIAATIEEAVNMFPRDESAKHLILLTDAMPTSGQTPENETLEAAAKAATGKVTISVIGINLGKEGQQMADRIVEIGRGRTFRVRSLENIDRIVLEDYYSVG